MYFRYYILFDFMHAASFRNVLNSPSKHIYVDKVMKSNATSIFICKATIKNTFCQYVKPLILIGEN
jgi:hypothetical protein